jgi:hypothetical protein
MTSPGRLQEPPDKTRFPGLPGNRRVVLDLAYAGFGRSAEIVDKKGELLAILAPGGLRYDAVPGAVVASHPLGLAVQKLAAENAKFDLIVAETDRDATTPAVGIFAPAAPPLARTGRRLVTDAVAAPKPAPKSIDLTLAVWRAAQRLLSEQGEAFLQMHVFSLNHMLQMKEPGLDRVWWAHVDRELAQLYVRNDYRWPPTAFSRTAPDRYSRDGLLDNVLEWTPGQRRVFERAL